MKQNWTHVYEPPVDFAQRLKDYDEALDIFWDAAAKDWVITRNGQTGYHEIGHYSYLDNRTVDSIAEGDLGRYRSSKEFLEYVDKHNGKIKESLKKKRMAQNEEDARRLYVERIREHKTQF